jgi:hypothetical protein
MCPTTYAGLLASYYTNIDLSGTPAVQQGELGVNYSWGLDSPGMGLPIDVFSARWSGYVTAPVSGTYTFYVTSDDGERLYVNGSLLVDKWVNQGDTTWTGTIDLNAGQTVPIIYETFENTDGATARLEWMVPGGSQTVIPSSALSYNPATPTSKVLATVKYNNPQKTVSNATYITSTCPSGFIVVPGSITYDTNDFCVMKYEAKNVGGVATSRAAGTPWALISQNNAIITSQDACTGCHLITQAEWLTIAQNVLSVPSNWSSGTVGTGYIYSGHNDDVPANAIAADTSDSNGYANTGNTSGNQRRTLTLTNGEVIWDLAGNVQEWTLGTVQSPIIQPGIAGAGGTWREWNTLTTTGTLPVNPFPSYGTPAASGWTATTNGIGMVYSNSDETGLRGFTRGGNWYYGGVAGVLTMNLGNSPSNVASNLGFRVSK